MASHAVKLEVKLNHIVEGTSNDPCFCPIALALREAIRNGDLPFVDKTHISVFNNVVYVTPDEIEIKLDDRSFIAQTTLDMDVFIEEFDEGKEVCPFTEIIEFMEQ